MAPADRAVDRAELAAALCFSMGNETRQVHVLIPSLPHSVRAELFERLRLQIARSILDIMEEQGITLEVLADNMKLRKKVLRHWIWTKDLTLSELSWLLGKMNAEFYPLIRPTKTWKGP